ncbi:MAG: hypothetical protein ACP5IG_04885, partial [Candidatus Micrarchaeia archaeon]
FMLRILVLNSLNITGKMKPQNPNFFITMLLLNPKATGEETKLGFSFLLTSLNLVEYSFYPSQRRILFEIN